MMASSKTARAIVAIAVATLALIGTAAALFRSVLIADALRTAEGERPPIARAMEPGFERMTYRFGVERGSERDRELRTDQLLTVAAAELWLRRTAPAHARGTAVQKVGAA